MITHGHIEGNNRHGGLLEGGRWGEGEDQKTTYWGYCAYYLHDKVICTPDPCDMQFTYITNLYMYPEPKIKSLKFRNLRNKTFQM